MANEKRLIDANALKAEIVDFKVNLRPQNQDYGTGYFSALSVVEGMLAYAPTVDAVPVVHGHWISLDKCSNAGVYCSVCHKKVWKEDYAWCNRKNKLRSNYCPNCGAKMDGSADNEID